MAITITTSRRSGHPRRPDDTEEFVVETGQRFQIGGSWNDGVAAAQRKRLGLAIAGLSVGLRSDRALPRELLILEPMSQGDSVNVRWASRSSDAQPGDTQNRNLRFELLHSRQGRPLPVSNMGSFDLRNGEWARIECLWNTGTNGGFLRFLTVTLTPRPTKSDITLSAPNDWTSGVNRLLDSEFWDASKPAMTAALMVQGVRLDVDESEFLEWLGDQLGTSRDAGAQSAGRAVQKLAAIVLTEGEGADSARAALRAHLSDYAGFRAYLLAPRGLEGLTSRRAVYEISRLLSKLVP